MKLKQTHIVLSLAILLYATCFSASSQDKKGSLGLSVICLDPGHGGNDPGCVSRDGTKIREKDIVLSVGLKVRKLLEECYPDLKVVMTRSDDTFIPLGNRADIANKAGAGLFISIHVNAVDPKKNKNYKSVNGFSIHTLGQSRTGADLYSSNMELCKRENSVILMEDDYSTTYQGFDPNDPESYIIFNLMQNANLVQSLLFADDLARSLSAGPVKKSRGISQDPFLVLWKTTMPAVLIECGFITSPSDLEKMKSSSGQDEIARRIVEAIVRFKTRYDESLNIPVTKPVISGSNASDEGSSVKQEPEKAVSGTDAAEEGTVYGTQVLATGRQMESGDSFFRGYKPMVIPAGNVFKYIIGTSADAAKAKEEYRKIKKLFPDSFMVKVEEGKTSRVQ